MARPIDCVGEEAPAVCGCDGLVYEHECGAHAAGYDIGAADCPADGGPLGTIPCGPVYCDAATSYCHRGDGDVPPPAFEGSCNVVSGNGVMGLMVAEVLI